MAMKLSANVFETDVVQPDEKFSFAVDLATRLKSTEEVTSVALVIFDKANADKTSTIKNGNPIIEDGAATKSQILVHLKGFVDGERYNVQIIATTNASTPQELEIDVFVPVKKIFNKVA